MKRTLFRSLLILAATLWLAGLAYSPARAQSTAFTYQGQLNDAGGLANGLHDFRFRLFDAAIGGAQIGATVCVDNVNVIEGVFTLQLDFGQQFATMAQRHLEIGVRANTGYDCSNAYGFVALAPRQQITAAPIASHANSAFSLDAADGSQESAVFVDNNGNVGIGTTAPTARLDVRGGAMLVENLGDQADLLWLASERSWVFRQEGTGAATALKLQNIGGGGNKNFIVQTDGFMGVGTTTPAAKLDVRGDIRLGPTGQLSAVAGEENLRMLRGNIDGNGTIDAGTGFDCTRTSEGQYTIFFWTPFPGVPSVTATPHSQSIEPRVAEIRSLTPSSVHVVISFVGNPETDSDWSLCVIGPR